MKILFLHIGDMHIVDRQGINFFQIKKLVDTFHGFGSFDKILLIIAGDISQSGQMEQYGHAKKLIGFLIAQIKRACNYSSKLDVICVPGNHDIDHGGKSRTSDELQTIRNTRAYDKCLPGELEKQEAFFNFSKFNNCFEEKSVFCRRVLDYQGFLIEVNMINSGVFSVLEEDKGLHYIPRGCINEITTPTGADFVITVMHHAPDWYTDEQKNYLEEAIYTKSSIVFLGHEHRLGEKTMVYGKNTPVLIQAGGCLCENANWLNSAFHIGVYDTETHVYDHLEYKWNNQEQQYEPQERMNNILPSKPSIEKCLRITDDFKTWLLSDDKHSICDNFLSYYVFPRIQSEERNGDNYKEYSTIDSYVEELLDKKKVLIQGSYNSGKTALSKALFLHLTNTDFTVLFCDIENIHGKNVDRIIKNSFVDVYGDNSSDYERYEQIPKDKKVLIIDNADQVKRDSLNAFLANIDERFGYVVLVSKQLIDISLFERMKAELETVNSVYRYRILPLYSDKRNELIERVVSLLIEDSGAVPKISHVLSETITAQRRFISLDPDFTIRYVEYYCNNIGDATHADSSVFSKVFEASLTTAISKYHTPRLSVDKVYVILSKIAHYIHFHKAYPISEGQIMSIVAQYNDDYGASVKGTDFITIATQAKILTPEGEGTQFRFANKNYLAYYVAKEVNSRYNDTGDDTDLQSILKCACFGINTDILMFISYITDNIRILRFILTMANEYTSEWMEFDFAENMPQFLREERKHIVELPPEDALQKEQQAEVMAEKASDENLYTLDIYGYSDEDADQFINQFIRAVQLLTVVARCLPNFEHNMLKADKEAFVEVIYSLPNKIFNMWAVETDKEVDEIIRFFKEQSRDYYVRQKELEDEDIIRALQWVSMSFLLELYNIPVFFATKDNTMGYLSSFGYSEKDTYKLEHLMMSERQAAAASFTEEAMNLGKGPKEHIYRTLIARIVSHALIHKDGFDHSLRQRLQAEYFPTKEAQKRINAKRFRKIQGENE